MEPKGIINIYKCSQGHETITMNLDIRKLVKTNINDVLRIYY